MSAIDPKGLMKSAREIQRHVQKKLKEQQEAEERKMKERERELEVEADEIERRMEKEANGEGGTPQIEKSDRTLEEQPPQKAQEEEQQQQQSTLPAISAKEKTPELYTPPHPTISNNHNNDLVENTAVELTT